MDGQDDGHAAPPARSESNAPDYYLILFAVFTGVVILFVVGALCVRYVMRGPEEIPPALTYAFATIIGLYFGSGTAIAAMLSRRSRR
jgi:hypothetical protein